jgi:hypothetical protein
MANKEQANTDVDESGGTKLNKLGIPFLNMENLDPRKM